MKEFPITKYQYISAASLQALEELVNEAREDGWRCDSPLIVEQLRSRDGDFLAAEYIQRMYSVKTF